MPASLPASMMLILVALASVKDAPSAAGSRSTEARFRRPVALVASPDGSRLFVANRRSGSVSIVDWNEGRVEAEFDVAKGLADLASWRDGRLLAVDREGNALVVLKAGEGSIEVEATLPVAPDPASVLVSPDGSFCVVASTASQRLSVISLSIDERKKVVTKLDRVIPLPFAPGLLAWAVPGSALVAADAFDGRIAVFDPALDHPDSVRSIPAHNIRGLARTLDGRSMVVAHQTLNRLAMTTFEDVHWGSLVGNHLRVLSIESVLNPQLDLLHGAKLVDLGRTGRAAGDPGAIGFDCQGKLAVALAGAHEVALLGDSISSQAQRVPVGQGPSAVLPSADGSHLYVADSLDDTISVVDINKGATVRTISLGPRPDLGAVERGERLFADARLSHDGWMSCRSCHADGRGNGLSVDTLSDGGFGAPKRVPSLLGVGSTAPWTWLGTIDRLEDQVRKSVETTMRGKPPTAEQVDDLTAYLRSLPPPRPTLAEGAEESIERGRTLFKTRRCAECHAPPGYTSEGTFDVGLVDEVGHRKFNPPSLRGVGDRAPYLHDGRAATLPDVFLRHRHPKESGWSHNEVEDLSAFLKTL